MKYPAKYKNIYIKFLNKAAWGFYSNKVITVNCLFGDYL